MTDQELSKLPKYEWIESRIPARDALVTFVPDGESPDPVVEKILERAGGSRWFPVQGGHRVLILFEGGTFDSSRFTIESCAWDHEHCYACGERISAMELCHVTVPEQPYNLLCAVCFQQHVASKRRP
jgi:hypothetical protein